MSDEDSIKILNSLVPKPLDLGELLKECPSNGHHEQDDSTTPKGCPYLNGSAPPKPVRSNSINKKFPEWQTSISVASEPVNYNDYLHLDKLLNAQYPESTKYGHPAHDEHLFIVVHQTYELWFKQLIFEIDSIRGLLEKPIVDERCLLVIVQRLQRINLIWKLLNDQITVLETMAPTDFIDFRGYLSTASGFQSIQFRLFENKLGLAESFRIKFNQQKYDYLFTDNESKEKIRKSVEEPSMLKLIEAWLERTPGLVSFDYTENGSKVEYNYLLKEYEKNVNQYLMDTYVKAAQVSLYNSFLFV